MNCMHCTSSRRFLLLALLSAGLLSACGGDRVLAIPNRLWEKGAPKEGWCGEASIQMAALYYGRLYTQQDIHTSVTVHHPDLWVEDMPRALHALGLEFTQWKGEKRDGTAFTDWIADQIRHGYPVIIGSKLYPSEHPKWNTDHLMLVTGVRNKALIINTNVDDGRIARYPAHLLKKRPYSFINRQGTFFGFAVKGFKE